MSWFIDSVDLVEEKSKSRVKLKAPSEGEMAKAKETRRLFNNLCGGSWAKWREDSNTSYDFALGDQLTEKQEKDLIKAGMPTFTVDKISQSVETLKYFITANNPKFVATGVDRSDSSTAAIHDAVFRHAFYISNFKSIFSQITEDALTKSLGYLFMRYDPDADHGAGEVFIDFLNPWDVWPDAASTDIMFRDASYVLVKKNFTKAYLINKFPQYEDRIMGASGTDEHNDNYSSRNTSTSLSIQPADIVNLVDMTGSTAQVIDYYERYFKKRIEYISLTIQKLPDKKQLKEIQKRVEAEVKLREQKIMEQIQDSFIALDDQMKEGLVSKERVAFEKQRLQKQAQDTLAEIKQTLLSKAISQVASIEYTVVSKEEYDLMKNDKLFKDTIISAVPYWETRIGVIVSVGGDTFLYESEIPISDYPMVPVPYRHTGTVYPISAVSKVVGKQKETNKAHQIMVHNASLGSSLRWMHQEGAIPNTDQWDKHSTIPGARLVYSIGYEAPTPVLPMQLANAFYEIASKGEVDIEESLGASPIGLSSNTPTDMPYKGLALVDETSTRRIRSWMATVVEPALEHFGKILTELTQVVYTHYKVLRLVDPDTMKLEKYEINVPVYGDLGTIASRFHDYASAKYDVRVVAGSTLPKNKRLELAERLELYKLQVIDDIAVLDKTDLPDKEEIMARKSLYSRLSNLNNMLENRVKDLEGDQQTLVRQLKQMGIDSKVKDYDVELNKALNDFKAALGAREAKFRAKLGELETVAEYDLKAVALKKAEKKGEK